MTRNLKPEEVYGLLTDDFQDVWNSVAWNPSARGRGNFMFAILAMAFLEFTCRLCWSDTAKKAIRKFSMHLNAIDGRYFVRIPGLKIASREFELPYIGTAQTGDYLICALFDLIRNGLAHQYQQIIAGLKDGKDLGITLTGPSVGRTLQYVTDSPRKSSNHLTYKRKGQGDLWVTVNPARLFLDFKDSFDKAKLLGMRLKVQPLMRPNPNHRGSKYGFTSLKLEGLLRGGKSGGFRK